MDALHDLSLTWHWTAVAALSCFVIAYAIAIAVRRAAVDGGEHSGRHVVGDHRPSAGHVRGAADVSGDVAWSVAAGHVDGRCRQLAAVDGQRRRRGADGPGAWHLHV